MRSTPRPGRGSLLQAAARRPAVPSLRFCRIPRARRIPSRDYRDSRAVLDTQWSFLRCVLMGLAAERRKERSPGGSKGFRIGVEPSPGGAKDTAQNLSPLPGLGVSRPGYPGRPPCEGYAFNLAERLGEADSPPWQRRGGRAIKKYPRSFKRRGRGGSFKLQNNFS